VRHRSEATLPRTRHHSVAVSEGALALVLVYNFDPTRRRFLLTPLKLTLSPGRRTGSTVIFDTHVEQENFFWEAVSTSNHFQNHFQVTSAAVTRRGDKSRLLIGARGK
jgi:hypothetical protein